jgi:hypothetical protein
MSASPFIELRSGRRFTPLQPVVADINIDDIAHALSHQCRFSGHTRVHYSVAEHSVRVSELVEAWGFNRGVQLWALLHDASEAYLVDLPQPLKADVVLGPAYRAAEDRLMLAVCERFGLTPVEPRPVRKADMVLLATEARDLMPFRPEHWSKLTHQPLPERIEPWLPEVARHNFIARYTRLADG